MEYKKLDKEKIKFCNEHYGDLAIFDEIQEQLKDKAIRNELQKTQDLEKIDELLSMAFSMNYVVIETETYDFAEKYYADAHELYYEIKIDLLQALGINLDWFFNENIV